MDRLRNLWDRAAGASRRWADRAWQTVRDPLRLLPILAVVALLVMSVPLVLTGLTRVGRAAMDWRQSATTEWRRADATVERVKIDDGLVVRVAFQDRTGDRHEVNVFAGDAAGKWVGRGVPIRYDARHPDDVELVGYAENDPIPILLLAGAPLGAGVAGLVLATALWRRRRLVAVSARPVSVLWGPIVVAVSITITGLAVWTVGTVWQRGWSAVASATGHLASTIFGDLLGVLVPLVAFALGCLVTAWLARHRHHDDHDGVLGSAHRFIDRAAGMVPSPEQMRPPDRDSDELRTPSR